MKVKKLLGKNGHKVNTISPDALVSDAMKLMSHLSGCAGFRRHEAHVKKRDQCACRV